MKKIIIILLITIIGIIGYFQGIGLWIFLNSGVLILILLVLYQIYLEVFKRGRNLIYKLDAYNDINTLNREIDCNYPPSVVALLINNSIKIQDLSADIMNLYAKKMIDVKKYKKENDILYDIKANENVSKNNKLLDSDKYILNTLIYKNERFDFDYWKELVNNNFLNLQFCKEHKSMGIKEIFKLSGIVMAIVTVIMCIVLNDLLFGCLLGIALGLSLVVPITVFSDYRDTRYNIQMHLNDKGKNEIKKWIKFKKFINEYTLIKNKSLEDIILYEKYIPYSVVMGLNRNYKGTIYAIFNETQIKKILDDINDDSFIEQNFRETDYKYKK